MYKQIIVIFREGDKIIRIAVLDEEEDIDFFLFQTGSAGMLSYLTEIRALR